MIAEGVESRKQMEILQSLGCHEVQGYLISRPLPSAEFGGFIARWNSGQVTHLA